MFSTSIEIKQDPLSLYSLKYSLQFWFIPIDSWVIPSWSAESLSFYVLQDPAKIAEPLWKVGFETILWLSLLKSTTEETFSIPLTARPYHLFEKQIYSKKYHQLRFNRWKVSNKESQVTGPSIVKNETPKPECNQKTSQTICPI